jgi:hypothetical protein
MSSISRIDEIFASKRSAPKMNKHFGGIFNDEHGKTRFAFTNTRLLLEGNEKKKMV